MNKIMTAVAAMTFACNAALTPAPCANCGATAVVDSECSTIVFKVTGSGKSVVRKNDYKTVSALKIKKAALALTGTYCSSTGACCYDTGMFYATIKSGKKEFKLAIEVAPTVWSVFGENYNRYVTKNCKQGKTYKLESALCIESQGDAALWGIEDVEDFAFVANAFGKVNMMFTKEKKTSKSSCSATYTAGCEPILTLKTYSGWFVGKHSCIGEEGCFMCDCADTDIFGGTWKATFMPKITTDDGARKFAGVPDIDEDDL